MAEKEMRNFALRDKDGNEIGVFTGKAAQAGCSESCESGSHRYQVEREGNQKSAYIYRREEAGKETQGCTCLDAR